MNGYNFLKSSEIKKKKCLKKFSIFYESQSIVQFS